MVNPRKPVAMMKLQGKIDSAVKIQAQLKVRLFEVLVWYDGVLCVSRMEPGDAVLLVSIWHCRTTLGSQMVYHYSECRNLSTSFISKCFCFEPQTLYWSYCTVFKMGKRPSRKLYTRKSRLCFYERGLPRIMWEMWRKGKHCWKKIGDLQIIYSILHRVSFMYIASYKSFAS